MLPIVVALLAIATSAIPAEAQPPRGPAGPSAARRARPSRRPPPPPELVLAVEADASRPYHVRVRLDVGTEALTDAVADLRLLRFEVLPPDASARTRPLRCAWPSAPSRNAADNVVASPPPGSALVDDFVDVRMYCVGAAYAAVARGGTLTPVYGYARATRQRYAARAARRGARPLAEVRGAAFRLRQIPAATEADIVVGMATADATRGGAVVLRPYAQGTPRGARAYVRDDLWSFDVRSPNGRTARCVVPRHPVSPILDFFTRFSAGRKVAFTIDLARLCPGFVDEPGIYDVVPILELIYNGSNVGIDALTGYFRGDPTFIRVRPPAGAVPSELVRPEPRPTTGTPSNSTTAPDPGAASP